MKPIFSFSAILILFLASSQAAFAYVGPGAGLSLLGALWGLVFALATALLFVMLWPLRRMRRRRQARMAAADTDVELGQDTGEQETSAPRQRSRSA